MKVPSPGLSVATVFVAGNNVEVTSADILTCIGGYRIPVGVETLAGW